jgi:hypothetical protein
MEKTAGRNRKKWTTLRVSEETANAVRLLSERWQVSAEEVISRLLELYDAFTESDQAAKKVANSYPEAAPATVNSPPLIEPEPREATTTDSEARQVVADMLYLMDAAVEVLFAIVGVYPDLRSECGPLLDRLSRRFAEVAQAWGLWQEQPPAEETSEEATEQQTENP